ncbi:MAG: ABC transporter substrate-binding protein [Acidimicrobiales bacterium]
MRSNWLRLLAALLAFTLIAAACGDDDDEPVSTGEDGGEASDDGGEPEPEPEPEPEDDGGEPEPEPEDDGGAASGGGECWEKDGRELRIEWNTVAGNKRREDVQALVQEMTRPIGICWIIENYDAGELFQNRLPVLNFDLALYANGSSPDPSVVALYTTIPKEENDFAGQNFTACETPDCLRMADLANEADAEVDPNARLAIMNEIGDLARSEVVWIPLYILPNMTLTRTDIIEGPIGDFGDSIYGTFANMYDWNLIGEEGGEAVFVAEQWPECLNPVNSCGNASWLAWAITSHTGARLMELDAEGNFVPSPILEKAPSVDDGSIVVNDDGTFTLVYNINPDAVWSDGVPITCDDIVFTRDAYLETTGTLTTAGYELITDIECSDGGLTATLTYSEPFAPWGDKFGGGTEYLLPAHGFESNDTGNDWLEEIPISGGPWLLESWSPEQATFVPNDAYWDADRAPLLDRVVFIPREDSDTEIATLESGEGSVAYPQPFPGIRERFSDTLTGQAHGSTFFEGLWLNQLAPDSGDLLSNIAVREALLFALDREEVASVALGPILGDDVEVLQCAGWVPAIGNWCDETDFADGVQDFAKVEEILLADGWTPPAGL